MMSSGVGLFNQHLRFNCTTKLDDVKCQISKQAVWRTYEKHMML